jgi:cysteinyl-tRNA synthetase
MDDDLNTPRALTAVFRFVRDANALLDANRVDREGAQSILDALKRVDTVLGVLSFEEEVLAPRLARLIEEREDARRRRDFEAADRIRERLLEEGIILEDSPKGTTWKRRPLG